MTHALRNQLPSDEANLVERVQEGDEAAFSAIYKRHARHVAGVIYRMLGHDDHLEDLVQETFIVGLRQLDQLQNPHALRAWLTTIAVRRVKQHLAQRYKSRELQRSLQSQPPPAVDDASAREEVHGLYRALNKLPDKLRVPWMLHHIEGQTLPAVAEMCDASLSSVKRHISAASERLRRQGHV